MASLNCSIASSIKLFCKKIIPILLLEGLCFNFFTFSAPATKKPWALWISGSIWLSSLGFLFINALAVENNSIFSSFRLAIKLPLSLVENCTALTIALLPCETRFLSCSISNCFILTSCPYTTLYEFSNEEICFSSTLNSSANLETEESSLWGA